MIRLLIALVIVALLLTKVSEMLGTKSDSETPPSPEETIVGKAYEPYTRAQQFSEEDYEEALDAKRKNLEERIDGGP